MPPEIEPSQARLLPLPPLPQDACPVEKGGRHDSSRGADQRWCGHRAVRRGSPGARTKPERACCCCRGLSHVAARARPSGCSRWCDASTVTGRSDPLHRATPTLRRVPEAPRALPVWGAAMFPIWTGTRSTTTSSRRSRGSPATHRLRQVNRLSPLCRGATNRRPRSRSTGGSPERRIAEGEDTAVAGDHPVSLAVVGRRHPRNGRR